jgi:Uma2 family endonuclease
VAEAFDWNWLKRAVDMPEITLDIYLDMPDDLSKQVEVVDGWLVRCESPGPSHQAIQHNLVSALRESVKDLDARDRTCHRVIGDLDILISEVPRFHFRRPDVVIYRCIDEDRGSWRRKPYASDCLLVLEIVSADSVTTDTRDKRAEYAAAGIPHYWIVRMARNDGPAISVERFRLSAGGEYVFEGIAIRGKDLRAVDTMDPVLTRISWEQLDDGI